MEEKSKTVQSMFNNIAFRYDFLNRLLSFRRDVAWRKKAIKLCSIKGTEIILDLACGTGDMIIQIKKDHPSVKVYGGDFSTNMLEIAKSKVKSVDFVASDAHCLPFANNSFDILTIAFGFRNVTDKMQGLREFKRVVKPRGKVCILEFSEPENKLFAVVYRFYFKKILPFLGGLISGNREAYDYLPDSVYKFPKREEYKKMILDAGFNGVEFKTMTFGIVTIAIIKS